MLTVKLVTMEAGFPLPACLGFRRLSALKSAPCPGQATGLDIHAENWRDWSASSAGIVK